MAAQGSRLEAQGNSLQPSAFSLQPRRAQASLDYAVFIAVVAAALLAMQIYVRRSIQANLKVLEDQINADVVH